MMEKEKFKPKLFTRLSFSLVPKDTQLKIDEDGIRFFSKNKSWSFEKIKDSLTSIYGIIQDASNKPRQDCDDGCYYIVIVNKEKIFFEINQGHANDDVECPSISIEFSNKIPSKECFNKFLDIIKQLNNSNKNLNFKIFSFAHQDFISLEKLSEINKIL